MAKGNNLNPYSTRFRENQIIAFPRVADVDWVSDGIDISATVAGDDIAITNARLPGTGRNLTVALTDASGTTLAGVFRVHGLDQFGKNITEDFTVAQGTPVVGEKIFETVERVEVRSITANAASDTLDIGFGSRVGLLTKLTAESQVKIERTLVDLDGTMGAGVMIVGTSTYVDLVNSSLKAVGSGGSGALAVEDFLQVYIQHKNEDPDDRLA